MAKVEHKIDATPTASGATHPEADSASQVLKVSMGEYRLVNSSLSNELKDLHDLEKGSAFNQNVNVVLVSPRRAFAVRGTGLLCSQCHSAERTLKTPSDSRAT